MKNFDLLYTFSKVAELGSFTKAAKALKQPKSRVSRAISRLENQVGVELIKRTTRNMSLTDSGKDLFLSIREPLKELQGSLDGLLSEQKVSGLIKLATPEDFGHSILANLISEFKELHPEVSFQITVSNEPADFIGQELDVAFRIGDFKDSSLIQKKIGSVHLILVASPKYLETFGEPKTMNDLCSHKILDFFNTDGESILDQVTGNSELNITFSSSSFALLFTLALKNRGIALMPDFFVAKAVKEGSLVQVVKNHKWESRNISLVYVPTKNMPVKTRAFIDFVVAKLKG